MTVGTWNSIQIGVLTALLSFSAEVFAHPFLSGEALVEVKDKEISVELKVVLLQICIEQNLMAGEDGIYLHGRLKAAMKKHATYVLDRFSVVINASDELKQLKGVFVSLGEPECQTPPVYHDNLEKLVVTYRMKFPLEGRPEQLLIVHKLLSDAEYTPGVNWQQTLILDCRLAEKWVCRNELLRQGEVKLIKLSASVGPTAPNDEKNKPYEQIHSPQVSPVVPQEGVLPAVGPKLPDSSGRVGSSGVPPGIWIMLGLFALLGVGGWLRWRMVEDKR